jgi:hypothetical protein
MRKHTGKISSEVKPVASSGIVKDGRYMDHWMGDYHPECPQRLEVIYAMLEERDILKDRSKDDVDISSRWHALQTGTGQGGNAADQRRAFLGSTRVKALP